MNVQRPDGPEPGAGPDAEWSRARDLLRADLACAAPDDGLDRRVLAAMAQARRGAAAAAAGPAPTMAHARKARPAHRRSVWAAGGLALAAGLIALSVLLTLQAPPARMPGDPQPLADATLRSGFVPVAGADWLRGLDNGATTAWLVPTEMPRERLGLLGLPYDPARAGETVRAELLMHGSGVVLAVRVAGP